jgi:hypothetical protein
VGEATGVSVALTPDEVGAAAEVVGVVAVARAPEGAVFVAVGVTPSPIAVAVAGVTPATTVSTSTVKGVEIPIRLLVL